MTTIRFIYDYRGYGALIVFEENKILLSVESRTGSIDHDGKLKNPLPEGEYWLCDKPEEPVESEKSLMYIPYLPGVPFKHRLEKYPVPVGHNRTSSYLIHPDGSADGKGKNGTLGCIGTLDNAMNYYNWAVEYFHKKDFKPVKVVTMTQGGKGWKA